MTTQKIKHGTLEGVLLDSLPELSSLAASEQSALERLAQRITTALRILTGKKEQEQSVRERLARQLARERLARQLASDLRRNGAVMQGAVMPGGGGSYLISPRVLSKEILNDILYQYDRDPIKLSKAQMLELAVSLKENLSGSEDFSQLYEEELLYILDEQFPQTEEAN